MMSLAKTAGAALCLGAALFASPAMLMAQSGQNGESSAQENAQNASPPPAAASPEDDLDCAMYLSMVLGNASAKMENSSRSGIIAGVAYFSGRYELASGQSIEQAMAARYPHFLASDKQSLAQSCSARLSAFGARLSKASVALSKVEAQQAPAQPSENATGAAGTGNR